MRTSTTMMSLETVPSSKKIEIMSESMTEPVYAQMVLKHRDSSDADDLEQLCLEIGRIQLIIRPAGCS
jgi:hypothetical protein